MRRTAMMAMMSLLVAGPLAAQDVNTDPVVALRRAFTEVSGWVAASAEMVPADKYGYRPSEPVRTFGQLIGHLADSYTYYCAVAAGRTVEWSDATEKGVTEKAVLLERLRQAMGTCAAPYTAGGGFRALVDNVGHTSIHYGNIVTYLRMMGLTPPSS